VTRDGTLPARCRRFGLLLSAAALLGLAWAAGPGVAASGWDDATERDATGTPLRRFIPVELWTGAEWDGGRTLALKPVRLSHRPAIPSDHPVITIEGPEPWSEDPTVMVLKRSRRSGRAGEIVQRFRINPQGDGIGRVSDVRRGRQGPVTEASKFPLGWWRAGEARAYEDRQHTRIIIEELDYVFLGVPHALRFRWQTTLKQDGDNSYVFAPGRGLVAVYHH
jgi:hypothetical protein